MIKLMSTAAILGALFAVSLAAPANAQTATRAWVSGHGADAAGCGAPTAPCRSLQYTHDNIVAAGGEIDILDPAGYGAITISKPISIINDGVGTAGVQATSGDAITIAAGASSVLLRGLNIEGVGASSGIRVETGGSLVVEDSAISNFSFTGIQYAPTSAAYFEVSNTRMNNDTNAGINIQPVIASGSAAVQVVVERSEANRDGDAGVFVDGRQSGTSVKVSATVADSLLSNSTQAGVFVDAPSNGAVVFTMVRNCVVTFSGEGVASQGGHATLDIGHSTLSGNGVAFSAAQTGVIGSYRDNNTDGNGGLGSTPAPLTLQ